MKKDIEDYVQDETFHKEMEKAGSIEKSWDRIEKRTAFVTDDIGWQGGLAA